MSPSDNQLSIMGKEILLWFLPAASSAHPSPAISRYNTADVLQYISCVCDILLFVPVLQQRNVQIRIGRWAEYAHKTGYREQKCERCSVEIESRASRTVTVQSNWRKLNV